MKTTKKTVKAGPAVIAAVMKRAPKAKRKETTVKVEMKPTTVSEAIHQLILSGQSNSEILDSLMTLFPGFDVAKKKYYPSWYRAHFVRRGVISKKQAQTVAH